MKKILNWLVLLPVMILAGACELDEMVYDHEQPAFAIKDGKILLEVVVPSTTSADDAIYISGEFNGANDTLAMEDIRWQLERSSKVTSKWGIYLDPSTFVAGKTLADGYHFVSATEGQERGVKNDIIVRTESPAVGTRTTLYISNWESSFIVSDFPKHSGYRVYIYDDTKWDAIALYQWGDVNDYGGGWPGAAVAGKHTFNGNEYKYFDFGDDAAGLNQNLIFNNNGNGVQLADYAYTFGEQTDIFLYVDASGVTPIEDPLTFTVEIPEVKLYVKNNAGWSDIRLYAEENGEPVVFGNWPGAEAEALVAEDGTETLCFTVPQEAYGKTVDLVFNTSTGAYLPEYTVVLDHDYNLTLNPTEVRDDQAVRVYINDMTGWANLAMYAYEGETPVAGNWPGYQFTEKVNVDGVDYYAYTFPYTLYGKTVNLIFSNMDEANPLQTPDYSVNLSRDTFINLKASGVETAEVKIYFINNSGWERTCLYAWGDAEVFGGWPGADVTGTETIYGKEYSYILVPASGYGKSVYLIFNNGDNGEQFDVASVVLDKDFYYEITNSAAAVVNPEAKSVSLYIAGVSGWESTYLYIWGDAEVLGGWPGSLPAETVTFSGVPYGRYEISADYYCSNANLILNNNAGSQFDAANISLDRDYFYSVTENSATELEEYPATRIYVEDNTGWDAIVLYCWGDSEVFGGWPGAQVAGTETIGDKTYKYFEVSAAAFGQTVNLIFNNNNNGVQIEGKEAQVSLKLNKDYYYNVTPDNAVFAE